MRGTHFVHRSRAKLRKHAGRVQIGLAKVRLVAEAKSVVQPRRANQENRYANKINSSYRVLQLVLFL